MCVPASTLICDEKDGGLSFLQYYTATISLKCINVNVKNIYQTCAVSRTAVIIFGTWLMKTTTLVIKYNILRLPGRGFLTHCPFGTPDGPQSGKHMSRYIYIQTAE